MPDSLSNTGTARSLFYMNYPPRATIPRKWIIEKVSDTTGDFFVNCSQYEPINRTLLSYQPEYSGTSSLHLFFSCECNQKRQFLFQSVLPCPDPATCENRFLHTPESTCNTQKTFSLIEWFGFQSVYCLPCP